MIQNKNILLYTSSIPNTELNKAINAFVSALSTKTLERILNNMHEDNSNKQRTLHRTLQKLNNVPKSLIKSQLPNDFVYKNITLKSPGDIIKFAEMFIVNSEYQKLIKKIKKLRYANNNLEMHKLFQIIHILKKESYAPLFNITKEQKQQLNIVYAILKFSYIKNYDLHMKLGSIFMKTF